MTSSSHSCGESLPRPWRILATAIQAVREIKEQLPATANIAWSCSTGYGEALLKAALMLDEGEVETISHYYAASRRPNWGSSSNTRCRKCSNSSCSRCRRPDIITVAKGIGNGFPMAGVLISPMFKPVYGPVSYTHLPQQLHPGNLRRNKKSHLK